MAKFCDIVGFGNTVKTSAGVLEDVITEYLYYGDIIQAIRRLDDNNQLNKELTVSNSISIVADEHARQHFFAIRYVRWSGVLWTVTSVEVKSPRLILRLGEVYNGPQPA